MSDLVHLVELLSTRLCHDLTGPIGAMNNGVEFFKEGDDDMKEQAVDLLESSAAEAVARLQFFRQCYGRVPPQGEASLSEKKELTEGLFRDGKVTLDWPETMTDSFSRPLSHAAARLLLNMILLASTTLIRHGTLRVDLIPKKDEIEIAVLTTGKSLKWEDEWAAAINGTLAPEDWTPKTAQLVWTAHQAKELNASMEAGISEDIFTVVAHLPA